MKVVDNPLTGTKTDIVACLHMIAAQEGCDSEPYDQIQQAAEYIRELEGRLLKESDILYDLARLARNTDGLFPSTWGREVAQLLVRLRNIDVEKYKRKVLQPEGE